MKLASLISLAAVALAIGACAVSVTPDNNTYPTLDGGGTKDGSGSDSASPGKDSSTPDTSVTNQGDSSVVDDTTCAAMSTKTMCEQCCTGVHKTGYGVYTKALTGCACMGTSACATECAADFCVGKPAGSACQTCLSASVAPMGACYSDISMACLGDADCTALYQTCIPPCESK